MQYLPPIHKEEINSHIAYRLCSHIVYYYDNYFPTLRTLFKANVSINLEINAFFEYFLFDFISSFMNEFDFLESSSSKEEDKERIKNVKYHFLEVVEAAIMGFRSQLDKENDTNA